MGQGIVDNEETVVVEPEDPEYVDTTDGDVDIGDPRPMQAGSKADESDDEGVRP